MFSQNVKFHVIFIDCCSNMHQSSSWFPAVPYVGLLSCNTSSCIQSNKWLVYHAQHTFIALFIKSLKVILEFSTPNSSITTISYIQTHTRTQTSILQHNSPSNKYPTFLRKDFMLLCNLYFNNTQHYYASSLVEATLYVDVFLQYNNKKFDFIELPFYKVVY